MLAAMSTGNIAFHLFTFDYSAKNGFDVKLIRRQKHSQIVNSQYVFIQSIDFHPKGELVAIVFSGNCEILDINSGNCVVSTDFLKKPNSERSNPISQLLFFLSLLIQFTGYFGLSRWSTNPDEQLLYVKYGQKTINCFDVEKKAFLFKDSSNSGKKEKRLSSREDVSWIDVCPINGNLIASCKRAEIMIIDRRQKRPIKSLDGVGEKYSLHFVPLFSFAFDHLSTKPNVIFNHFAVLGDWNHCLRWSPDGGYLANASMISSSVIDCRTWNIIHEVKASKHEYSLP